MHLICPRKCQQCGSPHVQSASGAPQARFRVSVTPLAANFPQDLARRRWGAPNGHGCAQGTARAASLQLRLRAPAHTRPCRKSAASAESAAVAPEADMAAARARGVARGRGARAARSECTVPRACARDTFQLLKNRERCGTAPGSPPRRITAEIDGGPVNSTPLSCTSWFGG